MSNLRYIKKIGLISLAIIIILSPIVSSVATCQKSVSNGNDVELYIRGGFLMHWGVINNKDEPVDCSIEIWMENFLGMGFNPGKIEFTVPPHDKHSDWFEAFPMPFYRIYGTLTIYDEKTLERTGFTVMGINFFLTSKIT